MSEDTNPNREVLKYGTYTKEHVRNATLLGRDYRQIEDDSLQTFQDDSSIVCRQIFSESERSAWKLEVGISRILYQTRHDEPRGKWGYKLHAKAGFAGSTQPMNIKLTTTNSPKQLD